MHYLLHWFSFWAWQSLRYLQVVTKYRVITVHREMNKVFMVMVTLLVTIKWEIKFDLIISLKTCCSSSNKKEAGPEVVQMRSDRNY